jgi:hypothetical protein
VASKSATKSASKFTKKLVSKAAAESDSDVKVIKLPLVTVKLFKKPGVVIVCHFCFSTIAVMKTHLQHLFCKNSFLWCKSAARWINITEEPVHHAGGDCCVYLAVASANVEEAKKWFIKEHALLFVRLNLRLLISIVLIKKEISQN